IYSKKIGMKNMIENLRGIIISPEQRDFIINELRRCKTLSVSVLAKRFGLSEAAIKILQRIANN
ncbi:hypothetical protein, partial [Pantoea anthophila]|uniref:hypothetical protein n=1 Tax=Pantoea anthophila TaxID=470931 RepID=UPI001C63CD3D